jgi:hypothetical protein
MLRGLPVIAALVIVGCGSSTDLSAVDKIEIRDAADGIAGRCDPGTLAVLDEPYRSRLARKLPAAIQNDVDVLLHAYDTTKGTKFVLDDTVVTMPELLQSARRSLANCNQVPGSGAQASRIERALGT